MCERSVLRLLRTKYPSIYNELTQRPALSDLRQVDRLLRLFCKVKGLEITDVVKNAGQSRMLFITVAVKVFDPIFFVDNNKTLMRGLREKLASCLLCHETQISHTLSTVRTYLRVYRLFREEVTYLYGEITKRIADEGQN